MTFASKLRYFWEAGPLGHVQLNICLSYIGMLSREKTKLHTCTSCPSIYKCKSVHFSHFKPTLKQLVQMNRNLVGNIYGTGRTSIKISHIVLIQ